LVLGQGSVVNFNNNVITTGDHKVYDDFVGNGSCLLGTNYVAELYYVDPGTSSLTPFADSISKFRITSTTSPGTWSGKAVTLPIEIGGVPFRASVHIWVAGSPDRNDVGYATTEGAQTA